jgi:hypothetical protein
MKLGHIRAAIWKNTTESGVFYGVTFERVYRAEDGSWKSAYSYGREDLLNLAKLADTAHTEVDALVKADRRPSSAKEAEPPDGEASQDGEPRHAEGSRRTRGVRGRERG